MLVSNFVRCSSPTIQQLLRRVCIQISDLSSLASTLIVRCVLDALLATIEETRVSTNNSNGSTTNCTFKPNDSLMHVLDLLSYLLSHPPFKCALIHSLHVGGKLDEKYSTIVSKMMNLLTYRPSNRIENHLNDLLLSIFHSLCDFTINLSHQVPNSSYLQIVSEHLSIIT